MGLEHAKGQDLPEFLKADTSAMIERWATLTRPKLSLPPSRQLSFEEFRDDVPEVLNNLANFLENRQDSGERPGSQEAANQHGHCRWRQGFNLKDLIRDWGDLQRVVLEWVNRFYEDKEAVESMDRSTATNMVAAFFTEAVCGSIARFDELRQDDAARMARELQRIRHQFDRMDDFRKRLLQDFSHDLRSPLTAISGASTILKSEGDEENGEEHEEFHELAAIIDESVAAATGLLNSLQQLSDIDSGVAKLSPARVDVAELLREVLNEWAKSPANASATGVIELSGPGSLEVEADADRLRKTFESIFAIQRTDGQAETIPMEGMTLRSMEDGWELQVRYAPPDAKKRGK